VTAADPAGTLRVSIAQIAPSLLDRDATTVRIVAAVNEAAAAGSRLVAFGESLLPGYPVWLSRTDGARFDDARQKALHARYLDQAVDLDAGHLDPVRDAARSGSVAVVLGVAERARDRGGHSLFCSCITIAPDGAIASVHRKLVPTYEERLCWSHGDGHGLRAHGFLAPFTLGALNCWENWMPLARAAMHAQGVDLHVALWPGGDVNTRDITRFIARESRSYVLSASALLRHEDIPPATPARDRILAGSSGAMLHNGGSAIAGPDGEWVVEPVVGREAVITVDLEHARVRGERQNFDPSGHYARPDVLRLAVNRERLRSAEFRDHA
jgi:nitrilase